MVGLNNISNKLQLEELGYTIIEEIYSITEIEKINALISAKTISKDTFRKSEDLFAIRQFLKEFPSIRDVIFNQKLKSIIKNILGCDYFIVKSLYFDKPKKSNWFVAYHQDLTISVDKKINIDGYGPWTIKQNQFSVQPPINILKSIYTIRIHLDDADINNGALKVIPKSHLHGVYKKDKKDSENEDVCAVKKGGIMMMRPLLFHSSSRTTNEKQRRVIHIELSNLNNLGKNLNWAEKENF